MYQDFRDFLNLLEKNGKLVRVQREVDTRFEIAAGIRKVSDIDGPALLYENIRNYPGWRIAAGVFATRKLLALALGDALHQTAEGPRVAGGPQAAIKRVPLLTDRFHSRRPLVKGPREEQERAVVRLPVCVVALVR